MNRWIFAAVAVVTNTLGSAATFHAGELTHGGVMSTAAIMWGCAGIVLMGIATTAMAVFGVMTGRSSTN